MNMEKIAEKVLIILIAILISVISIFVVANRVNKLPVIKETNERLDETNDIVFNLSAAVVTLSGIITLMPDDFATPIANTLSDMSKYCIGVLAIVVFEKIILNHGIHFVFAYGVPIICLLYVLAALFKNDLLKTIATKVLILSMTVVLVIPIGTSVSSAVTADGMAALRTVISEVNDYNEEQSNDSDLDNSSKDVLSTISDSFQSVVNNVTVFMQKIKTIIKDFMVGISILIVGSLVIPLLTFWLIMWVLNQIFQFQSFKESSDRTKTQMLALIDKCKAVMENVLEEEEKHEAE